MAWEWLELETDGAYAYFNRRKETQYPCDKCMSCGRLRRRGLTKDEIDYLGYKHCWETMYSCVLGYDTVSANCK